MTQVLQSPPHLTSPSNPCGQISPEDDSQPNALIGNSVEEHLGAKERDNNREGDQLSFLTLLVAVFRKSLVTCSSCERTELSSNMEIGCPSDVRHVAHVTFDRFNGFLGLPVEFEPEVPRRAPSARLVLYVIFDYKSILMGISVFLHLGDDILVLFMFVGFVIGEHVLILPFLYALLNIYPLIYCLYYLV